MTLTRSDVERLKDYLSGNMTIRGPLMPTDGILRALLSRLTALERVREAAVLVDQVWERANLYPDINFLGDDEHEAWSKCREALSNCPPLAERGEKEKS